MRHIVMYVSFSIILIGCGKQSNVVSPTTDYDYSDSLRFTFSIPKTSFGIHDTLIAGLTVFNEASTPDSIVYGPSLFLWSLQNSDGRTIMYGPGLSPLWVTIETIGPHQTMGLYSIRQPIADMSGQQIAAGSYLLKASIASPKLQFSLSLFLH